VVAPGSSLAIKPADVVLILVQAAVVALAMVVSVVLVEAPQLELYGLETLVNSQQLM
jgi:hypothetical protein